MGEWKEQAGRNVKGLNQFMALLRGELENLPPEADAG